MPDDRANGRTEPPHDLDAEVSVLGAVLLNSSAISQIPWLRPDDFYRTNNGEILRACRSLFSRGEPIDNITLGAELEHMGVLERIGGRGHLALLQESVPTAYNLVHYATIVRELALKRRAIEKGQAVVTAGFDPTKTARETIAVAQRAALELADYAIDDAGPEPVGDLLAQYMARMDEAQETGIKGLSTGFHDLDRCLRGLKAGDLIIVAGRPSMGKSALGVQVGYHIAQQYGPVALFSLEVSREQVVERVVSMAAQIDKERLDRGLLSDREWEVLNNTLGPLAELPLHVDDQRDLDELTLQAKVRNLALSAEVQAKGGLQAVVVDYLQLLSSSSRIDNRVQEVSLFSKSLKTLAGEMRLPVIALSQLSREPEKRQDKRPILSDLRDSGSLEQDADIVLLLFRADYYERDQSKHNGLCEVIVAKHRNGSTGDVKLRFIRKQTRFEDHVELASANSPQYEAA